MEVLDAAADGLGDARGGEVGSMSFGVAVDLGDVRSVQAMLAQVRRQRGQSGPLLPPFPPES
jgi:hypothetical protein